MKTSSSQFVMMVTFMEQHGDLSKPTTNARGRITSMKNWDELSLLLNSDGSGDTKTTEKWKKVWSDFKNNTKKKAARLHKAASGTGGGPAVFSKLTDLEQRVLNLIGVQVATGLAVEEAGLPQEIHVQPNPTFVNTGQGATPRQFVESQQLNEATQNATNIASPSLMRAISSPPLTFIEEEEVQSFQPNWNEPGPSRIIAPAQSPPPTTAPLSFLDIQVEETGMLSPTRPSSHVRVVQPEPVMSVQATPRRARTRTRGSPRRRARPAHIEQATEHFLQADSFWRNFKEQQHRDNMDLRREENRIREMEVQAQREWQAVGHRGLNLLEKIVDKFCKD